MESALAGGVVVLVVVVVGFFLFRAVLLWYWKIDTQIALLREISANLQRLAASPALAPPASIAPTSFEQAVASTPTSFERVIPAPPPAQAPGRPLRG